MTMDHTIFELSRTGMTVTRLAGKSAAAEGDA